MTIAVAMAERKEKSRASPKAKHLLLSTWHYQRTVLPRVSPWLNAKLMWHKALGGPPLDNRPAPSLRAKWSWPSPSLVPSYPLSHDSRVWFHFHMWLRVHTHRRTHPTLQHLYCSLGAAARLGLNGGGCLARALGRGFCFHLEKCPFRDA